MTESPLETRDLQLVRYRPNDREFFLELVLDPVVMARVDGPATDAAAATLFDTIASDSSTERSRCWAIRLRTPNTYIGHAWITNSEQEPEIGFVLSPLHWGRGLATQAASAVLEYGHSSLSLPRIAATVDVDHAASRRVLQKIGMAFERIVDSPPEPYAVYGSNRSHSA